MNGMQISHDAWTYNEFGARSFEHDIRALILDHLDQSPDRRTVPMKLRQQASAVPLPIVPISLERVALESQPSNADGICDMPGLGLRVELDKQDQTIAVYRRFPKLLAKIRDRVARQVALDLCEGIFSGSYSDGVIPLPASGGQLLIYSGEDREAVPGSPSERIRFPTAPPAWAEAPLRFE